jgi:hypothetical protein
MILCSNAMDGNFLRLSLTVILIFEVSFNFSQLDGAKSQLREREKSDENSHALPSSRSSIMVVCYVLLFNCL